jgi:hypothetical protein
LGKPFLPEEGFPKLFPEEADIAQATAPNHHFK